MFHCRLSSSKNSSHIIHSHIKTVSAGKKNFSKKIAATFAAFKYLFKCFCVKIARDKNTFNLIFKLAFKEKFLDNKFNKLVFY